MNNIKVFIILSVFLLASCNANPKEMSGDEEGTGVSSVITDKTEAFIKPAPAETTSSVPVITAVKPATAEPDITIEPARITYPTVDAAADAAISVGGSVNGDSFFSYAYEIIGQEENGQGITVYMLITQGEYTWFAGGVCEVSGTEPQAAVLELSAIDGEYCIDEFIEFDDYKLYGEYINVNDGDSPAFPMTVNEVRRYKTDITMQKKAKAGEYFSGYDYNPPAVDDPRGLIKSVKRIDLSLPENSVYQANIDIISSESGYYPGNIIPIGENYILSENYCIYYIDGKTKEKRILLEGYGADKPYTLNENSPGIINLRFGSDNIKLVNLAGLHYSYHLREVIDSSRFIYGVGGWEWSEGSGLFDISKNQNIPFVYEGEKYDVYGHNEDKIYCVKVNQGWYTGWVDDLDVLEVDLDDYSVKLNPVALPELKDEISEHFIYSEDFSFLAVPTNNSVYIYGVDNGEVPAVISFSDDILGYEYYPEDDKLYFVSDKTIYIITAYNVMFEVLLN